MAFGLPEDSEKLTYGGYLRVDDLLTLQQLRSDPGHHDETLFIVIHQVYELWFKQILHEIDDIVVRIGAGDLLGASRLLRRCIEIQRILVAQLTVLETMLPTDFLAFRDHLMPASGFQSAQFREIEFASGLKDDRMLAHHAEGSPARARLDRRHTAPSLRDAFHAALVRERLTPDAAGIAELYRDAASHPELFMVAEALTEYDALFSVWRIRHVQMVERVIGGRPGTGGSEGAAYLRGTVDRRFFPEIWEARTLIAATGHR
jgi:tryptophan 2,3-dioxygenase